MEVFPLPLSQRPELRQTGSWAAAASDVIMMPVPWPSHSDQGLSQPSGELLSLLWFGKWLLGASCWELGLGSSRRGKSLSSAQGESREEVEELLRSGRGHEHHLPQGLGERVGELAPPSTLFCVGPSLP